ncbi:DUF6803 family protein [[Pasteurella] aerogenes]|nr:Uncharacterised protein [[Pasteurella] aerogenes]
MYMTNYMDLLGANQPWNLLFFMIIPVALAEALVATEFFSVYLGTRANLSKKWNKFLSIVAGLYYTALVIYFIVTILPTIEFRGAIDITAIVFLILGLFPILALALMELGLWGKNAATETYIYRRFFLLISFLIISHLAMVFGMLNPTLSGWQPEVGQMQPMSHEMNNMTMPMTDHSDHNQMMNEMMHNPQNTMPADSDHKSHHNP